MNKLKFVLSYMFPILIEVRKGEINKCLEVRMCNGKYVLDSSTVNYSYGDLQKLFDLLFRKIKIKDYEFRNALVLGMGAGSVISLLMEKYKKKCQVTAVERDGIVIELARKYFNIHRFIPLNVIKEDAFKFTSVENKKYDLIIVDLFIDTDVPKIFNSIEFISNLRKIASDNCCLIYNKITDTPFQKEELKKIILVFEEYFPGTKMYKFTCSGTENTFIYCNTLPSKDRIILSKEKNKRQEMSWANFKPVLHSLKNYGED